MIQQGDPMNSNINATGENEIDLIGLLNWFWARKISFIVLVFLGAALLTGYSYLVPKKYTATVDLLPKIPVQRAGLLGPLASLTGESMALEGVDEELYGRVLSSHLILDRVITRQWPTSVSSDSVSLIDVFHLDNLRVEKGQGFAEHVLKNIMRNSVIKFDRDPVNGVMKIQVTVPENPVLAASLANVLADELESYNRSLNTQKTIKFRDFVDNRLVEVQSKLEDAEVNLTGFLQNNERFRSSPKLMQEYGELEREVQAYKAIWLQLRSKLENANIDVNKEIDSINILDRARPPYHRSAPKRWIYLFTGAFLGFLAALGFELIRLWYGKRYF